MKVKQLHCQHFGPYQDWSFTPAASGLHIVYGPNESGKTCLLEAFRGMLFGFTTKQRKNSAGSLDIVRADGDYHIGRDGKKVFVYRQGGDSQSVEPASLWWHGLDRKTYEKIFALTLDDLQGLDILQNVDVRTRFFGAPGGERLSEAVKDIQKASEALLVSSANGKRIINCLLDDLQANEQEIKRLQGQEEVYVGLTKEVEHSVKNEAELQESLQQWKEYGKSVDLVLHAWDTYKRAEEAKAKMDTLTQASLPDQQAFMELEREISQCQEQMRFWRGKEQSLVPENFSPQAPVGQFAQDIETLYEQLGRWEQLVKWCERDVRELEKQQERLRLAKSMCMTWRRESPMPTTVDWIQGEQVAQSLRRAQEQVAQWAKQEPNTLFETFRPQGMPEPAEVTKDLTFGGLVVSTAQVKEVETVAGHMETLSKAYSALSAARQSAQSTVTKPPMYRMVGLLISVVMLVATLVWGFSLGFSAITQGCILLSVAGIAVGWYYYNRAPKGDVSETMAVQEAALAKAAEALTVPTPTDEAALFAIRDQWEAFQRAFYGQDLAKLQDFTVQQQQESWEETQARFAKELDSAQQAWNAWRPEGANETCGPEHFFAMQREYDAYQEQRQGVEALAAQLQEEQEALRDIESQAQVLWGKLGVREALNTITLRQIYRQLQGHRQNQIRYEQKESQRRNFREEYDKAHCREKDLLMQQEEILQRNGFTSATEFRSQLISAEQYRQWESIYKQSRVQLQLLAPNQDTYDLMTRRLREGNRQKWLDEQSRAREQIATYEQRLAKLYEERGQVQEAMRQLGGSRELTMALQQASHLEASLQQSLEDWATQVFLKHFLDVAQERYEEESQPAVMDMASTYLQRLTDGKYRLAMQATDGSITVLNDAGVPHQPTHWSSGLSDQIYLALRLSLAKRFGQEVEPMPIILDDVLNRFDENRQRAAVQLLGELAETEQIFLLTCLESVANMACEHLADGSYHRYRFTEKGLEEVV